MTKAQQREAIRLLRVIAAASMGTTKFSPHVEEWLGWQDGVLEGVRNVSSDARKLLDGLSGDGGKQS